MTTKAVEVSIEERKGKLGPERYYVIEGVGSLPSVTTVLSMSGMKGPALIEWAASKRVDQAIEAAYSIAPQCLMKDKHAAAINELLKQEKRADRAALEAAGKIGTEVHQRISAYLSGEIRFNVISLEADKCWGRWHEWWESKPRKAILIEQPIWNEFSGYAGTIDCVAEEADGSITLYDWKTSSGIYADHHLQAAAYLAAYDERVSRTGLRTGWDSVGRAMLVHIPKNGGVVKEVPLGEISKDQKRTPDELFDAFLGLLEAWRILH